MGERHREPRNGAKEFLQRRFFRPVPGLVNWLRGPTAHAVGYVVSPSGLGALVAGQFCPRPHSFPNNGNAARVCGADPLVCAGRPRPAAGATISASCKARAGRRGRRSQSRGTAARSMQVRGGAKTMWHPARQPAPRRPEAYGPLRALTSPVLARFVSWAVVFSGSPASGLCRFRTPVWPPGITAGAQALAILVVYLGIAKNP